MARPVEQLTAWFDGLTKSEQEAVVTFLYGGKALLLKGLYTGPVPGLVSRGLHCGPVPEMSTATCPTCGRAY